MKCSSETLQNLIHFVYKKTPCSLFRFSFRATLYFYLMNALVYVDIHQGIHIVKCKVARNTKKTTWVFLYIKYRKFWSVSLEHFIERKPLIYEE